VVNPGRGVIENKHREAFLSNFPEQPFGMTQGQKTAKKSCEEAQISPFSVLILNDPPALNPKP